MSSFSAADSAQQIKEYVLESEEIQLLKERISELERKLEEKESQAPRRERIEQMSSEVVQLY